MNSSEQQFANIRLYIELHKLILVYILYTYCVYHNVV